MFILIFIEVRPNYTGISRSTANNGTVAFDEYLLAILFINIPDATSNNNNFLLKCICSTGFNSCIRWILYAWSYNFLEFAMWCIWEKLNRLEWHRIGHGNILLMFLLLNMLTEAIDFVIPINYDAHVFGDKWLIRFDFRCPHTMTDKFIYQIIINYYKGSNLPPF